MKRSPLKRKTRLRPRSKKREAEIHVGKVRANICQTKCTTPKDKAALRDVVAAAGRLMGRAYPEATARMVKLDGVAVRRDEVTVLPPRRAGTARAKLRPMRSPTYRKWLKTQPCALCRLLDVPRRMQAPAVEPHHWPPVGVLGQTIDLLSIPICRRHHDECHAGRVRIDAQERAVFATLRTLVDRYPDILRAMLAEMIR